jgi:hypothetical protein
MKNKALKIGIAAVGAVILIICLATFFGITNTEMEKRKNTLSQYDVVQLYFDKSHKTIAQQAGIAERNFDKSKEAYEDIYVAMMEKRYQEGEKMLMKWVQEDNPQFDLNATSALYQTLMNTVEAQREGFFMENKKLVSMNNDYEKYCEKRPFNSMVIGEYSKLDIVLVTSSNTKKVFEKGEENDIDLF